MTRKTIAFQVRRSKETSKIETIQWQNFTHVQSFQSKYGKLTLIKTGTDITLYSNGLVICTSPDKEAAEELFKMTFSIERPICLKNRQLYGFWVE